MNDVKELLKEFAKRKGVSEFRIKYGIKSAGDLWYETEKFLEENRERELSGPQNTAIYFEGFEGDDYIKIKSLINHIKDMPDANVKSELMSLFGGCVR